MKLSRTLAALAVVASASMVGCGPGQDGEADGLDAQPTATLSSAVWRPANTFLGAMKAKTNVQSGPGASWQYALALTYPSGIAAYVNAGEYVTVTGQENGWYHIEYSISGSPSLKRGYVPIDSVTIRQPTVNGITVWSGKAAYVDTNRDGYIDSRDTVSIATDGNLAVRSGPGAEYAVIGVLFNMDRVYNIRAEVADAKGEEAPYVDCAGQPYPGYKTAKSWWACDGNNRQYGGDWMLVEYPTAKGSKRGYIPAGNAVVL